MERKPYVSPEYQQRLDNLAHTLVTSRRFGYVVLNSSEMGTTTASAHLMDSLLEDTVEFPAIQDTLFDDDNIVRAEE